MPRWSRIKPDFRVFVRGIFGPHTDLNMEFFMQDRNGGSVPTHVGESGRFAVRIRCVWIVGCGEPELAEGAAMAGRGRTVQKLDLLEMIVLSSLKSRS